MAIKRIELPRGHKFKWGEDPTRFLLDPDEFRRPSLSIPNGETFVWPVGTEAFEVRGQAEVAIHKSIGVTDVDANVIYVNEPHISLSGTFPGHTAVDHMRKLEDVILAKTPEKGKILRVPFVFPRLQYVIVESWNFNHDQDDRTRSIAYQISFLKVGVSKGIDVKDPDDPDQNPIPGGDPAPTNRIFIVKDGYRTLRKISKRVYKTPDKWERIYRMNRKKIDSWKKKNNISQHHLPFARLPLGMRLSY